MTSKYDGAMISVINWDIYNPRKTSSRPTWFRFENSIATGPGFFGLDCEQKWLWIVILSLISQKNGQPIIWNSAYIQSVTGIKPKKQTETIDIFVKFVRLHVSRAQTVRDWYPTDGRTDETDETNETNETNGMCSEPSDDSCRALVPYASLSGTFLERQVKTALQESWLNAFPDSEWVVTQVHLALAWEAANPQRRKKLFGKFMTGWLTRGWDRRKLQPSGPVKTDYSFLDEVKE